GKEEEGYGQEERRKSEIVIFLSPLKCPKSPMYKAHDHSPPLDQIVPNKID
ncbi:hypothetical protein A2U01_0089600, partial [Trifolium medium]|nr:hypothetical protein [Trifolium medium]